MYSLTHAHILLAPIWLKGRASIYALNRSGTERESFAFAFTILAGGRLLCFSSTFPPGRGYTCPKPCLETVGMPGSCRGEGNGWSHFSRKKKKKVHCNINFRSDRGGFFPGIGSCKPLAARCDRPPGSWMRPKEFNAFYSATGRQATGHQGSSTESQHLCKGFQTMFQHPDTIPTPPLAEDSLA